MKKLLLTLILFADIHPLLSMELPNQFSDVAQPEYTASEHIEPVSSNTLSKLPTIILIQVYHHLANVLSRDIAQHILFLQGIKLSPITLPQIYYHLTDALSKDIVQHIFSLLPGIDQINDDFPQIDAKSAMLLAMAVEGSNKLNGHCLTVERLKRNLLRRKISICEVRNHCNETTLHYASKIGVTRILLEVADHEVWTLLTAQSEENRSTVLHYAMHNDTIKMIKLLLDAAGDNVQFFMDIQDNKGETAFDMAAPEVKELMQQYQNKNQ